MTCNQNLVYAIATRLEFSNQFFYDASFNLIRTVDPLGNPTTFGYNAKFQQTAITNGAGDVVTMIYNAGDGTLTSRTDTGRNHQLHLRFFRSN